MEEGKEKVMREKIGNLPFEIIKERLILMIIKRMLLFMSSIAFIVNFYYVEGH